MNRTKIIKLSLLTSSLLLLSACGGGGSGGEAQTPTYSSNKIVPTTINIDIPDGLKSDRTNTPSQKQTFQKTTETIPSRGYQQLKVTVDEVERTIKGVKENMVLLNSMMPDIQTQCQGTEVNALCTIPSGVISLTINSTIISEITAIQNEFGSVNPQSLPPLNTVLTMGKVLYTQFDNTHTYQQNVVLDLKPTFEALGKTVEKKLETVKWSEDKNSIETISNIDEEEGKYTMHLTYNKIPNGITNMYIAHNYSLTTGDETSNGNFTFSMKETNDVNNTITVDVSGANTSNSNTDTFKENGELSDNGGFLISKGSFDGSEFAEKETFDKEGNLLKSKYCDTFSSTTCNIDDQKTWHTFDETLGIDNDSFEEDNFDSESDYVFNAQELTVTGGTLINGICDILPPSFDTTNIGQGEGIFENSIGNIFKFETETEASIFNNTYIDQLDTVKVICFNGSTAEFFELTGSDRPTLTIKSNSTNQ